MPDDPREFRARAAEFERLADETSNLDAREVALLIAERWSMLAQNENERQAMLPRSAEFN
jgi:hypothetical protein